MKHLYRIEYHDEQDRLRSHHIRAESGDAAADTLDYIEGCPEESVAQITMVPTTTPARYSVWLSGHNYTCGCYADARARCMSARHWAHDPHVRDRETDAVYRF